MLTVDTRASSLQAMQAFYQRLACDDEFRGRLTANPQATLREYGIELPVEACQPESITLPAKEEIAAALQDMTFGQDFVIKAEETLGWGWWAAWAIFALKPSQLVSNVKSRN